MEFAASTAVQDEEREEEMRACQADIDKCQFGSWYPALASWSIKSKVIPIPSDFTLFMREDGIVLPASCGGAEYHSNLSDSEDEGEDEQGEHPSEKQPEFPALQEAIQKAIDDFGGEIFIKSNWSAPIDASWMNAGSMKCTSVKDVFLLLKSSDRIMFDLDHMYDLCPSEQRQPSSFVLVIRKWANLHPSMEFRMFVVNSRLAGICQRDCTAFYPFLPSKISELAEHLMDWFEDTFESRSGHLPASYCLDVYVDKKERVWVIDVNPFGAPSHPLLFEWTELLSSTTTLVKVVENAGQKLASTLGTKRGPVDVHMAPDFQQFMTLCKQQQNEGDSSSDED